MALEKAVANGDHADTDVPEVSAAVTEEAPVTSTAIVLHSRAKASNSTYSKPIKPRLGAGLEDAMVTGTNRTPGLVGLSNLGNTCYMNSSLQCLLHTVPLMRSFLSGQYRQDINRKNPLGQKGELAESFSALMASVWRQDVQYVTPRSFKAKIGRFCPAFTGYGQQDSQELLAFLLDGLHEDLNRIKEKPYTSEKDDDDQKRPDDEVAARQWALHRSRNDSLVVDHCLGLYRSTLVCPRCNHTSRKFDPVMYLSLPLPESRQRSLMVTLVHIDGSQAPVKYVVEVPSVGTVKELLHALAKLAGIEVLPPSVATSRVTSVAASLDALGRSNGDAAAPGAQADGLQPAATAHAGGQPGAGATYSAIRPQDVLLLAKISQTMFNESVEVFSDVKTRVSEIVPQERTYHGQQEFLVCYRYPGPQWGPGNKALQQVVLHHRRRRAGMHMNARPFAAPLVLLLPKESAELQPEQLREEGSMYDTEYIVSEQAPLVACVRQALLPFHTAQGEGTGPAAEAAQGQAGEESQAVMDVVEAGAKAILEEVEATEAARRSAKPSVATAESTELMEEFRVSNLADTAEGAGTEEQAGEQGDGDAGMTAQPGPDSQLADGERRDSIAAEAIGTLAGEDGADDAGQMDWESTAMAAAVAMNFAKAATAVSLLDGGGEGAGESRPGSGAHSTWNGATAAQSSPVAGPEVQPFDMWAGQVTAEAAETSNGAADRTGPAGVSSSKPQLAFTVQVCHAGRMDRRFTRGADPMSQLCSTYTFTVNWPDPAPCPAAGGSYDTAAMEQPTPHESWVRAEQQSAQGRRPVTLAACFEAFLQPEQLSEDDSWYCPKCKDHVEADKKLDLWQLPEVLVVHLKRFCYTRSHREKLCTQVDFPLEGLDLSRYLLRPQGIAPVYDCYAVSNHFGGLGGGHYTAYCKMPDTGQWYCFDDSHVSPAEPADVMGPAAYVLFYRRRADAAQDPPDLLQQLFEARAQQEAEERAAAERSKEQQPDLDREQDQNELCGRTANAVSGSGARNNLLPPGESLAEPATRRFHAVSSDAEDGDSNGPQEVGGANYGGFTTGALGIRSVGHASDDQDLYGAADADDVWDGIAGNNSRDAVAADEEATMLFIQNATNRVISFGDRPGPNSPAQSDVIRQPGSDDDEAVEIGLDDEESSGQDGMALMSTSPNA